MQFREVKFVGGTFVQIEACLCDFKQHLVCDTPNAQHRGVIETMAVLNAQFMSYESYNDFVHAYHQN